MPVLLTDFWIYIINQWSSSLWAEEPCCNIAGACAPCGTMSRPLVTAQSPCPIPPAFIPTTIHSGPTSCAAQAIVCSSITFLYATASPSGQDLIWFIHCMSFGSFFFAFLRMQPFFFLLSISIQKASIHSFSHCLQCSWICSEFYYITILLSQMLSCIHIKWCQENLKSKITSCLTLSRYMEKRENGRKSLFFFHGRTW